MKPKTHMVIPDCQVRPRTNNDFLAWIGNYVEAKRPDVLVNIGDFTDMTSLSMYAVGKAESEGRRYMADIRSGKEGMAKLLKPIKHKPSRMVLTLGNHEDRIDREAENNPKWKGTVSTADLCYESFGWKVAPFLTVANLDGIEYSHYFVSGAMGRPVSSAAALLRIRQNSAVMGHVQRVDLAVHPNTQAIGLFAGICYTHDENYLTPQGNNTKRGIWVLHEVHNGTFDPMFVSLDFLKRKYS